MSDPTPVLSGITPMIPAGKDLQAASAFYEQKLGFTATYKDDDMVILRRDSTEIILQNSDDPHTASQTSFRIQLSGVDALYDEYQARDIAPFHEGKDGGLGTIKQMPWGTREFAVRDLAGVCITFYERLVK
ncbi:MAG TPA: VOC family protein [Phototrophicaceae bacterium]|nr:VOC family protein [Phototrophicaceae bacterium]